MHPAAQNPETEFLPPDLSAAEEALTRQVVERLGGKYQPPALDPKRSKYRQKNARSRVVGNIARAAEGQLDYLSIRRCGNFGNNFSQLVHAIAMARATGVSTVRHNFPPFRNISRLDGVTLTRRPAPAQQAGLEAAFFVAKPWPVLENLPSSEFVRISDQYLRPNLRWRAPRARGKLVLNLRGGKDIFRTDRPPSNYGQPPLSFYIAAARAIMERHKITHIEIIAHDHRNPILEPLLAWAETTAPEVTIGGGGVKRDAKAILSAEHLVMGETTFTSALALLSWNLKSLSTFEIRQRFLPGALEIAVPERFAFTDADRAYSVVQRWRGTPEQRLEMIHYPESALVMQHTRQNVDRRGRFLSALRRRLGW